MRPVCGAPSNLSMVVRLCDTGLTKYFARWTGLNEREKMVKDEDKCFRS